MSIFGPLQQVCCAGMSSFCIFITATLHSPSTYCQCQYYSTSYSTVLVSVFERTSNHVDQTASTPSLQSSSSQLPLRTRTFPFISTAGSSKGSKNGSLSGPLVTVTAGRHSSIVLGFRVPGLRGHMLTPTRTSSNLLLMCNAMVTTFTPTFTNSV